MSETEPLAYACLWAQFRPHPRGAHIYHVFRPRRTDADGELRYLRSLCGRSLDRFDLPVAQPPAMHRLCKICRAASGRGTRKE